jgi:hypothetical protein
MWWLKNKSRIWVLMFFFFFGLNSVNAQREIQQGEKAPLKDRMYFGGNLGLSFGTITFIDISPLAGVMLTNTLSGGVGGTFQYFNDSRFPEADNTIYGGRVFLRNNIFQNFFLHTEYESLNLDLYNPIFDRFERDWVPGFFIGGGYFTPFGRRGGVNFTMLYNVLYDNQRSPYNSPFVIRFGVFL